MAASPVNNPSSNQPNLQETPQSVPRGRMRHRRYDMQGGRDVVDRDRVMNIAEAGRQFGQQGSTRCRLGLSLAQNLPRTVAVILLLARLHRLLATGLPVRQETGKQSALAATSPEREHEHRQHRGEAGGIGDRGLHGMPGRILCQIRLISDERCSKFIPPTLKIQCRLARKSPTACRKGPANPTSRTKAPESGRRLVVHRQACR